jgi:AraC family transcriptional regulator
MDSSGILPVRAVEVLRKGHIVSPILTVSAVSSRHVGWNGIALEAFRDVPASHIPEHEHPTHFLNLFTSGRIRAQWTMDGRTRTADHGPGTLYLLPAGSRDLASWSGPNSRILLVMEPRFLAGALDETAHLADVELRPNWSFQDRHVVGILRALHADLEDGSPAGPLYGQSLSVALAHYLIRRFAVRKTHDREYRNGMPAARLNRVLDFMRQNYAKETRLWELANLAGMSPHYFCELFKKSTGVSPYQYSLQCRMDRAKEFLRSPQFTVRHVAEVTGFADQSHFTKVFHRMVGVTPLQFRA